jgi:flagellar hook assembly protein FlgD
MLRQNVPNPFNPSTIIGYDIAEAGEVTLAVYDVAGALIAVLEKTYREPGRYEKGWNGENQRGEKVASGVYFCRLAAPGFAQTRKMLLLK